MTLRMAVEIPSDLRRQLNSLRRRLWARHLADAAGWAVIGWALAFLLVYGSDRLWDTPRAMRLALLSVAWVGIARIPWVVWRRVWRCRRPDDLARLLAKSDPRLGRPLLGVIELAASGSEQARSRALVVAAISQVADQLRPRDLADSLPASRHRIRLAAAAMLAATAGALWLASAPAGHNAWARLATPLAEVPRFTFARLRPLPESLVVPHGEPFRLDLQLAAASSWRPSAAVLQIPDVGRVRSDLLEGTYPFRVTGRIAPTRLAVRVGDFFDSVAVEPRLRPELRDIELVVRLPAYLGREGEVREPVRGGTARVVRGSRFAVAATASRELSMATMNGQAVEIEGNRFRSPMARIPDGPTGDAATSLRFRWQDRDGLGGADPFGLSVLGIEDQPPGIRHEGFPSQEWVLDRDVVEFRLIVEDDFGVRRVGFEWETVDDDERSSGERLVGIGGPEQTRLELLTAFSPADLGIDAQPISIRPFAEDYLPGRGRVYAEPALLRVVAADRHATWVSDRLRRWGRASAELRDRERSLHERNRELRALDPSELDRPEVRLELRRQAMEEQIGARRLRELVRDGEELLREAMRNPESDPETVGTLATTMRSLKDIADRRMPTVADLLKQASATRPDDPDGPGDPDDPGDGGPRPQTADVESTLRQRPDGPSTPDRQLADDADQDAPAPPTLGLPTTMVAGPTADKSATDGPVDDGAEERAVDQAVDQQRALLEEFDEVSEELSAAIDGLEGSTFVKRLKAASRAQQEIASQLAPLMLSIRSAPSPGEFTAEIRETLGRLQNRQSDEARQMAELQSDLEAFFRRSLSPAHRSILMQMREEDPAASLRKLSEDLGRLIGLAIAETEFWSDTMDRWAEDLVPISESEDREEDAPPAAGLPPKIVLEVLRVLDGEVKLRTQTRAAEQARQAITAEEHRRSASRLAVQQKGLRDRIDRVVAALDAMADEESDYAGESALLSTVGKLMGESARLLAAGETGPITIAAETEVIETMLQSNRFNPSGGGGGGGSSPGGGGTGTTDAEAIALIGLRADPGASRAGRSDDSSARHTTAGTGETLPEEFRGGLHQYFNRIERWKDR